MFARCSIPHGAFVRRLRELHRSPTGSITQPATVAVHEGNIEFLAIEPDAPRPNPLQDVQARISYRIIDKLPLSDTIGGADPAHVDECRLYITPEGSLSGWVQFGHHRGPLNQVLLPGTGLHRHQPGVSSPFPTDPNDRLRWSRLIGALGESAWKRLRQQQYALIGLGRIGSMLTNDLAHLGVSSVIGVDPDLVEIWNLDAMDGVLLTDIAQPKVEAIARWFRQVWPPGRFSSIPYPIESTFALNRCKQADIIFSCADNEHARFTAAMLATFYHRPLIEIGTGVLDIHGQRRCGLEIRTILPDGNGCPVCLCGPFERNLLRRSPEEFGQGERLSSLRSLNHAAVGHAMMQLELLAQGSLSVSTHLRIDFDHQGNIQRNFSRHLQQNPQCTFCTYKGAGDIGLRCMDDLERLYIHGAM